MGPNDHLYPSISNIIPDIGLPEGLDFLNETAETLFEKIVYADFLVESNRQGSEYNYQLSLVAPKPVTLNFLGASDLKIGLSSISGGSGKIKLNFYWKWQIIKYIQDFNIQSFSDAPREFFNLLLSIAGVSLKDLIGEIISTCLPSYSRIDTLIDRLNTERNLGIPAGVSDINNLIEFFEQNQLDGLEELFQTFVNDADIDNIWSNFLKIFERFIGAFDKKTLRSLLTPEFSIKLNDLALGLYFPRKFLIPVDQNDDLIPEGSNNDTSKLEVSVGQIIYSTKNGFHFNGLSPTINLTRSSIGKTGIIISCQQAKLDLSRTTNIPEADAEGRPVDFVGVYAQEAVIGLPAQWFDQDSGATLGIFGRNLLIGTGGISGTIGLEVIGSPGQGPGAGEELFFTLGKKPASGPRKGFKIGFEHFQMTWQQNTLINSSVKGSITIPKFKRYDANGNPISGPLRIDIEALFEQDGDFSITASNSKGIEIRFGDVFSYTIKSLTVGKDDDRVFLGTTGSLKFEGMLGQYLKDPIELKKFVIYSDGSFELEGGSIPLPESARIKVGPTEISITAIHMGSHTQDHNGQLRKYKYFGFDGGVSVNPGGVDARGDGIKYYFTVDNDANNKPHSFLKIESLAVDLIIPGSASPETATLILKGYLALKTPEYEGSIEFQLPKAKMAGGASMKWNTQKPSFVIDAWLELSTALPLGSTGLGIFGFRGLFGLRNVADKKKPQPADTWTDWYRANPRGVSTKKFDDPGSKAKNPFSIGAGVSLATMADDGKAFSSQLFLLLSIPNLIMLEGRANVLGKRVGLIDGDPPFYAMIGFSPGESIELGFGADYFVPQEGNEKGQVLRLFADVRGAYFFKNSKAWFFNFGTKDKPITAEIISLFNGYSYLMLSASGIEAGAGVDFGFDKRYAGGMVAASARVYMDIWGRVSFERPQIGGGVAVGGNVSATLLGIGFYLGIDTVLTAEAPKPFKVYGMVELCIAVKLVVKKVEKCFKVEFTWEKSKTLDTTPIQPLPPPATGGKPIPVQGVHIASGRTYSVNYFGLNRPGAGQISDIVPLDTYIDIQFEKPLIPNAITSKIGGRSTDLPEGFEDIIPPTRGDRIVTHQYSIKSINLLIHANNTWEEYHPYEALAESSQWSNVSQYKIGAWQLTGKEHNKIRLLAQTPFSYTQKGQASWYIPEQMGLTAGTLFCPGKERKETCVSFKGFQQFSGGKLYSYNVLGLRFSPKGGSLQSNILMVPPGETLDIYLPESIVSCRFMYSSADPAAEILCYREERDINGILTGYKLVATKIVPRTTSTQTIEFLQTDLSQPIHKVTLKVTGPDQNLILQLLADIELLQTELFETIDLSAERRVQILNDLAIKQGALTYESIRGCLKPLSREEMIPYIEYLKALIDQYTKDLDRMKSVISQLCAGVTDWKTINNPGIIIRPGGIRPLNSLPFTGGGKPNPGGSVGGKRIGINLQLPDKPGKITLPGTGAPGNIGSVSLFPGRPLEPGPINSTGLNTKCAEAIQNYRKKLVELKQLEATLEEIGFLIQFEGEQFCGVHLRSMCWMTEKDVLYNSLIPSQQAIEEDYQLMKEAIENTVVPVWRPNSTFLVEVALTDTVNGIESGPWKFYYGFKTSGPLGYFDDKAIKIQKQDDLDEHELNAKAGLGKEAPENMLKYYLDYDKSFPNADGRILYAKPLYYYNPSFLVFFKDAYPYHFFQKWPKYQGLSELNFNMGIVIKDPVEDISGSGHTAQVININKLPAATHFGYQNYDDDKPANEISLINNLIPEGCWTHGVDLIKPKKKYIQFTAEHLQPLKLYTAIILNNDITGKSSKEVHRYSFQTSRYRNLAEHIQSYKMTDSKYPGQTKEAVFAIDLKMPTDTQADLQKLASLKTAAFKVVSGQPLTGRPELEATYTDPFDRLIEGVLRIGALPPPVCTEFNVLKNGSEVIAIWIRSPEPFNDPKIPQTELIKTVQLLKKDGSSNLPKMYSLFSRDCSQVFFMHQSKVISVKSLRVQFSSMEWDRSKYVIKGQPVVTDVISLLV
jgi:hypothetical protein